MRRFRIWTLAAAFALASAPGAGAARADGAPAGPRFRETSEAWGLVFRHHHGGSGRRYFLETLGGGVLLFDYDGDGDPDVLFTDAGALPGYEGEPARTALYRNDGGGRFVDVTERAGLETPAYGTGGSAADIDGDGDTDLYLTAWGENVMWRNQGDGTFIKATAETGTADAGWGTSAGFADTDRDGDLDLYVANYVEFTIAGHKECNTNGIPGYCAPASFDGQTDVFFRNLGDGRFERALETAGLVTDKPRAGLGVVFGDVTNDGWPDLYVANDSVSNYLFLNRGDGTFEDVSLLSGTAYGDSGRPEAGMGVDLGDVDGDGWLDIAVTNYELETNALYKNAGGDLFLDNRYASNVAEASLMKLAFGADLEDFDLDGDLDLAIANGHILDNAEVHQAHSSYRQANQIYVNQGSGRFRVEPEAGLSEVRVSRGLASGDLDGDGDADLVISNSNDLAEVYENVTSSGHRWLQVGLAAPGGNPLGIGARLELEAAGRRQLREMRTASSFHSQNPATTIFGVGPAERDSADRLTVIWPGGERLTLVAPPLDRRLRIVTSLAVAAAVALEPGS